MEDLVAVALELEDGEEHFFVTWGRIQHPVDPGPLERLVMDNAHGFSLGGTAVRARLCGSLREAAHAPYFYEALFNFARQGPLAANYAKWRSARAEAMAAGKELYYVGRSVTP